MSRIYFHSVDGDTEVHGSERAHFGGFCSDVTWTVISPFADESFGSRSILRNVFPPNHYALKSDDFLDSARLFFRVSEEMITLGDKNVDLFSLTLNTALWLGSDPVKLGARLHGQCEIHAYVNGSNRDWLASIIAEGRRSLFFRDDVGWESVIELLESADDSPVVTSYSVCSPFPNMEIADFKPPELIDGKTSDLSGDTEPNWDAWYNLSDREQWDMGIQGLRESDINRLLELRPETWKNYYFGDGMNAMQLVNTLLKLYPHS